MKVQSCMRIKEGTSGYYEIWPSIKGEKNKNTQGPPEYNMKKNPQTWRSGIQGPTSKTWRTNTLNTTESALIRESVNMIQWICWSQMCESIETSRMASFSEDEQLSVDGTPAITLSYPLLFSLIHILVSTSILVL